ncbi:MAG: hypothetical protein ACTSP3_00450 [Candidatus Heimdallarchaeaceae archaeon]
MFASTSTIIEQKLAFLKILGLIQKIDDKIQLETNFFTYVEKLLSTSQKISQSRNYRRRYERRKLRTYLIRSLAKNSFKLAGDKYIFYKQAATLLIFTFMCHKLDSGDYIKIDKSTVSDIKKFFSDMDYSPLNVNGRLIEFNTQKLENALFILKYLKLAESIKLKKGRIFYPIFNPYLLYDIIKNQLSTNRKGISIESVVKVIGEKYIPIVKKEKPEFNMKLHNSVGGSLWILYSREHIILKEEGDVPIVPHLPIFLIAKFGSKVNWIEMVKKNGQ